MRPIFSSYEICDMAGILEHIYSLTNKPKACWKEVCCHEYLQKLGLNLYGEIVLTECNLMTTTRERLLLKLSIIQKLFKNHNRVLCVKKFEFCNGLLNDFNLLEDLTNCLRFGDQLLVFSASKALSQVLQFLPFTAKHSKWFCSFLDFQSVQIKNSPWRILYTWSVLSHLLDSYHSNKNHLEDAEQYTCSCQSSCEKCLCFSDTEEMTNFMVFYVLKRIEVLTFNCLSFWKEFRDIKTTCDSLLENKQAGLEGRQFKGFCVEVHKREISCFFLQPDFEDQFYALLSLFYEVIKCVAAIKQKYNIPKSNHIGILGHARDHTRRYINEDCQLDEKESLTKAMQCSKVLTESFCFDNDMKLSLIEFSKADVFPLLVQCLHYKHLSQILFQKVLDIVDQLLTFAEKKSTYQESSDNIFERVVIDTAKSFISVLNCCVWENMPRFQGFIGFGGRVSAKSPDGVGSRKCQKHFDDNSLRKVSLVLLRSLVILGNCETDILQGRQAIAENLSSWAEKLKRSTAEANQKYVLQDPLTGYKGTKYSRDVQIKDILCDLFAEQDDELIEVLFLLLQLNSKLQKSSPDFTSAANPEGEERILAVTREINPHHLFLSFLQTVCFDHSVLLDFLVSNETVFLSYLVSYLHCVLNDWSAFASSLKGSADTCSEYSVNDKEDTFASIGYNKTTEYREGNNLSIPVNGSFMDADILALGAKNVVEQNSDFFNVRSSNTGDSCIMDDKNDVGGDDDDGNHKSSEGYDDDDDPNAGDGDDDKENDDVEDIGIDDDVDDHNAGDGDDDNERDDDDDIGSDDDDDDHNTGDDDDDDNERDDDDIGSDDDDGNDHNAGDGDDHNRIDDDYNESDDDNGSDDNGSDDDDNGGDDDNNGSDDNKSDDDDDDDDDSGKYDDDNNNSDDRSDDYSSNDKNEPFQSSSSSLANCCNFGIDSATYSDDHIPDPIYNLKQIPFRDPLEAAPVSLEKAMSVLIRLRFSIERLSASDLFPYSPKPLLRLLHKVENVYEGC